MPDLTIIIPALNEADNLAELMPRIWQVIEPIGIKVEVIVIDEEADERTRLVVAQNNGILLKPKTCGYGNALRAGFEQASSDYIATMDADLSHPPEFLNALWEARHSADVLIASRYISGGKAKMPLPRFLLSKILNVFFSRGLDLHIRDLSSGYRLYARKVIQISSLEGENFNILQEILVRALLEGYRIKEIPFHYEPRKIGSSHAQVIPFGIAYMRTFSKLWLLRNSILSADYDSRAFDSWLIPQRYWQRKRFKYISKMVENNRRCLDIGCGSSRILETLPAGSVGLDILFRKLRFSRRYNRNMVQGSLFRLPVPNNSFPCIICSQVIEHINREGVFDELARVLEPGGDLILGTPDYGKWQWKIIEWLYGIILPQAYADEHITHYSFEDLKQELVEKRGFSLIEKKYILQGELILKLRKPHP